MVAVNDSHERKNDASIAFAHPSQLTPKCQGLAKIRTGTDTGPTGAAVYSFSAAKDGGLHVPGPSISKFDCVYFCR